MQAICEQCGGRFALSVANDDIPTLCSEDCEQMFFRGAGEVPEYEPQPDDCMEDAPHEVYGE